MGAVATTEQAIINEAHRRGFAAAHDRVREVQGDTTVVGVRVAFPKKGFTDRQYDLNNHIQCV